MRSIPTLTPPTARRLRTAAAVLAGAATLAHAGTMRPLDDDELARTQGAGGVAFNLTNFSLAGDLSLTYTMPGPSGHRLWLGQLTLSRSDDPAATFSDPYTLRVLPRGNGLADVIRLAEPQNAAGLLKWQFATDWGTHADGIDFHGGALLVKDLVTRGGSLTLTTPSAPEVQGIAFGLALQADIGHLLLRPRGRDDAAQADPASVTEQLRVSGIRIGAASEAGVLLGQPWAIADATLQPGIFNALTDAGGSYLHLGIAWPTSAAGAPMGGLAIDSVVFKSAALPGGQLDLGSSRIGTLQLQYLDVKLKAGF